MKVVLLAGGMGTRLREHTELRPKPMVEIGGQPILWHIMKHYARYGFREFVVALGYKGDFIKRYFLDYFQLSGSMTVRLGTGHIEHHRRDCDDWTVHLIDTGLETLTGGRLLRLKPLLDGQPFLLTYGDGVSDVDLDGLVRAHRTSGRTGTVTAVRPPARFGGISFRGDLVTEFTEKPQIGEGWINGGFMMFEPTVFSYLENDRSILEHDVLERLAEKGELGAYRHERFWQCMDTMRDLQLLESLWQSGSPPWRTWA